MARAVWNTEENKSDSVSWNNFGRIGRLTFYQGVAPMGGINTDGLDFRFRANRIVNSGNEQVVPSVSLSILGLNANSVNELARFCGDAEYLKRDISVGVEVGYENDPAGMQELFHMPLWRANPSPPPDNWLELTLKPYFIRGGLKSWEFIRTQGSFGGGGKFNVRNLLQAIEKAYGLHFLIHNEAKDFVNKQVVNFFGCSGGEQGAIDALRKKYPQLVFVLDPKKIESGTQRGNCYYDVHWVYDKHPKRNIWKVDKDHGMIGLPQYTGGTLGNKFVKVRILMNPSVDAFDLIELKSEIVRDFTDIYRVRTISHSGHLRGNEWYTDLECDQIRLDDNGNEVESEGEGNGEQTEQ